MSVRQPIFYTSIWLHLRLSCGFTFKIEFIKRQLELMALMAKKRPQSIFIEFSSKLKENSFCKAEKDVYVLLGEIQKMGR